MYDDNIETLKYKPLLTVNVISTFNVNLYMPDLSGV